MYEFRISWVVPLKPVAGGGVTGEGTQAGEGRGKGRGGQGGRGSGKVTKKGGLRGPHLNICLRAPESLVTPLDGWTVRTQRTPASTIDSIRTEFYSGNFDNPPKSFRSGL